MEWIIIDRGLATLLAATIAAIISVFTLIFTIILNKNQEIRSARRKTLSEFIYSLSKSVHELIAVSNILLKNKTKESRDKWTKKAEKAKSKLKKLRPKIRYALWGLDRPIKVLYLLPDFVNYTRESEEVSKKVVHNGSKLGNALDNCIRKCYLQGRSPRFYERWYLNYLANNCQNIRNKYKSKRAIHNIN